MIAVDTSVAIPLLLQSHRFHTDVVHWWAGRDLALSGHAAIETYSVLTRLPDDARLTAQDAAKLIADRFAPTLLVSPASTRSLPSTLARLGIAGGAVSDAIVALAAHENDCVLATRDARAKSTYDLIHARVAIVA